MTNKPTLASIILWRHLWAAGITLGVVMLALLALADQVNLHARAQSLARELREEVAADPDGALNPGVFRCTGRLVLSASGEIICAGMGMGRAMGRGHGFGPGRGRVVQWAPAQTVLNTGAAQGIGKLPCSSEQAVWAAVLVTDTPAGSMVVVNWDHISSVRAGMLTTYGAVILATLLAFAVSMGLALRTARYVTAAVDAVADSGDRLAAGDYSVRLHPQPTAELDRVSHSLNRMADVQQHTINELQAEHARLSALEGAQRRFVADASHELRAPLTTMRVTLEAWQDGLLRPEEYCEAISRLRVETDRLAGLVTQLLDLSRLEAGREQLGLEPLNLAEVIRHGLSAYMANGSEGAPVQTDLRDDLPRVQADPSAVTRIVLNLVENARHFTPAQGHIRVWAAEDEVGIRLCVSDTGTGIAPDLLPTIWDRFARAEQSGGTGLGLAIVKALAEAMGGSVGAESMPGRETTVWVRLLKA